VVASSTARLVNAEGGLTGSRWSRYAAQKADCRAAFEVEHTSLEVFTNGGGNTIGGDGVCRAGRSFEFASERRFVDPVKRVGVFPHSSACRVADRKRFAALFRTFLMPKVVPDDRGHIACDSS
jgi:hypothetical protein